MNLFDYCEVMEKDDYGNYTLNFKGTAYLLESVVDGEVDLDSGEYYVLGVDGESEEDVYNYVNTFTPGTYLVHQYCWMVTDWNEEDGLLWNVYDSGGTNCEEVIVK